MLGLQQGIRKANQGWTWLPFFWVKLLQIALSPWGTWCYSRFYPLQVATGPGSECGVTIEQPKCSLSAHCGPKSESGHSPERANLRAIERIETWSLRKSDKLLLGRRTPAREFRCVLREAHYRVCVDVHGANKDPRTCLVQLLLTTDRAAVNLILGKLA